MKKLRSIKLLQRVTALALSAAIALSGSVLALADEDSDKDVSQMTPQEIVTDMKIGWNLGNSLDAHGNSYPSVQAAETYWSNPVTTEDMIKTVKAAGFNTVRVPVTWYEKCDTSNDYKIDEAWFKRVKEVVDYGINNDMYVILNIHHEEENWLVPTYAKQSYCEDRLTKYWTQIATYFKDYDRHLIFETMNEPREVGSGSEWSGGTAENQAVINSYNNTALKAIRATGGNNETRLVMCPSNAAAITALSGYTVPDDDNVAVSIHNYSPWSFAGTLSGSSSWGSDSDKAELKSQLEDLYTRFVAKGTPVVIGEMGAIYRGSGVTDTRPIWAQYYTSTARAYGITCVVWDNNKSAADGDGYGLLNRSALTWYFPDVVKALISGVNDGAEVELPNVSDITGTTGGTIAEDAYTTVLYNGSSSLSDYGSVVIVDLTKSNPLVEGCDVLVSYSSDKEPYLVLQNWSTGEWNKIAPYKTENGIAYYSYKDIVNGCSTGIANQLEMLVQTDNTQTTVTSVAVVKPHLSTSGKLGTIDAAIILKYLAGIINLTSTDLSYADYNADKNVNMKDVIAILNA
jgi:endoglucanase